MFVSSLIGAYLVIGGEFVHKSMVEVDESFFSLIYSNKVSVDVVRIVSDDMVIELTVL